jgi:tetratricopeptide (TPR) repeat protein
METLYDLLGALPRDDADELRAAFRSAVKGVHPDLNPGDPNAAQKFREIVRANEILGDEEQRAAYDHLLDLAHKEQKQQATAKTMHKAATSVIALVMVAGAGFGGYLAHQHLPMVSERLKHFAETATASPADFAGLTPAQAKAQPAGAPPQTRIKAADATTEATTTDVKPAADAMAQAAPAEANVQIASVEPPPTESPEKTETTGSVPAEGPVPAPATPKAQSESAPQASVGPPLEIAPGDAKVFRERGIFAYRSGDLYGAISEFDRAIQIDPKFSAAYVDRGIVLYRLQQFERAFADIAHAKRIERTKRAKADGKKKSPQATATLGFTPFFQQRRTAKLD